MNSGKAVEKFAANLTILFVIFGMAGMACAAPIDLSNWHQEGPLGNGYWRVENDGSAAYQLINGEPTYFVSGNDYINNELKGTFQVQTSRDDDYIGFVFGFNGLDDYYLFDWKQRDQRHDRGIGYEGFTLSKVSGNAGPDEIRAHQGSNITMLESIYGWDKGWADYREYEFTLLYQTDLIKIDIDGTTIFDVAGTFSSGRFGFYNFSQSLVRYQGFEEFAAPPDPVEPVPEPATVVLLSLGLCGLAGSGNTFKKKK